MLGDEYIKSEFRAHRSVDNPMHVVSLLARLRWAPGLTAVDRLPDGMADVRAEGGGEGVEGGKDR